MANFKDIEGIIDEINNKCERTESLISTKENAIKTEKDNVSKETKKMLSEMKTKYEQFRQSNLVSVYDQINSLVQILKADYKEEWEKASESIKENSSVSADSLLTENKRKVDKASKSSRKTVENADDYSSLESKLSCLLTEINDGIKQLNLIDFSQLVPELHISPISDTEFAVVDSTGTTIYTCNAESDKVSIDNGKPEKSMLIQSTDSVDESEIPASGDDGRDSSSEDIDDDVRSFMELFDKVAYGKEGNKDTLSLLDESDDVDSSGKDGVKKEKITIRDKKPLKAIVDNLFESCQSAMQYINLLLDKTDKDFDISGYSKQVKNSASVWLNEKNAQFENDYNKAYYELWEAPAVQDKYNNFFDELSEEGRIYDVDLKNGSLEYKEKINIGDAYFNIIERDIPFGTYDKYFNYISDCEALKSKPNVIFSEDKDSIGINAPIVLDLKKCGNVVVSVNDNTYESEVVNFVNQLIIQFLMSFPAGRIKIDLIDIRDCMRFSSFKSLTKINSGILLDGIIRDDRKFDDAIRNMEQIMYAVEEDKLSLNGVADIFEYNRKFDAAPQDIYLFVLAGSPEGLRSDSAKRVAKILQNGNRCGIFSIVVHNEDAVVDSLFKKPDYDKYCESLKKNAVYVKYDSYYGFSLKTNSRSLSFYPKQNITIDLLPDIIETLSESAEQSQQKVIPLTEMFNYTDSIEKSGKVKYGPEYTLDIPIGKCGGEVQTLQLKTSGGSAHAVVIGGTGSGKSNLLHAIILNACYRYSPEDLNFYLVDFKGGVEFKFYEADKNKDMQLPHIRLTGLTSDLNDGVSILTNLQKQLHDRENLFRINRVEDIIQFRKNGNKLPRLVVIIDEIQELFERNEALGQKAINILSELCKKGRAFGINILWASQNVPHVPGLKDKVLSQIGNKISLRLNDPNNALDLDMDLNLIKGLNRPEKGLGVIKDERYGNASMEFRVAYAESSETRVDFVKTIINKWKDVIKANDFAPLFIVGGDAVPSPVELPASYAVTPSDNTISDKQSEYSVELGRDYITGQPYLITLKAEDRENILVLGTDIEILRDIAGYALLSVVMDYKTDINYRNNPTGVFCANGEIIKADNKEDLFNVVKADFSEIIENVFKPDNLAEAVADLYQVYKTRNAEAEESEMAQLFVPYYVVIHNFQRYIDIFNANKALPADDMGNIDSFDFGASLNSRSSKMGVADAFRELYLKGGKYGIHFIITMDNYKSFTTLSRDLPNCNYQIATKGVNPSIVTDIFNDMKVSDSLKNPQLALVHNNGDRTKISLYRYDPETDSDWYDKLRNDYKNLG